MAQGTVNFNNFGNTEGGVLNYFNGAMTVSDGIVAQLYFSTTMGGSLWAWGRLRQ